LAVCFKVCSANSMAACGRSLLSGVFDFSL
jgi:hypothetical protein